MKSFIDPLLFKNLDKKAWRREKEHCLVFIDIFHIFSACKNWFFLMSLGHLLKEYDTHQKQNVFSCYIFQTFTFQLENDASWNQISNGI